MNVLYVCSDTAIPVLGRKAASVHIRSLATAFRRAGHSVVIATPLLTRSSWERPATLDAHILHVPANDAIGAVVDAVRDYNDALGVSNTVPNELRRILYNQQLEARLVRQFQNAPPDFIYERAALYSTAGVGVARALGVPLLVEFNAPLSFEHLAYRGSNLPALASRAERLTLGAADFVLTVSAALRDYVVEQGVAHERAVIVPHAVDPDLFAPGEASATTLARWGIGPGPVIGFVGGLRPWHGVRALPPLLERLAHRSPRLQMVIAGDGPLRDELDAAFRQRGIADRVVFTGRVAHEEMPDIIRTFDVALAPYDETEHMFYLSPLKLYEYMGCGAAVVAAALGQIAEVVRDNENGLLYPPGNLDALAGACERLLDDGELRHRLGGAAAALIRREFTWARNAARIVQLVKGMAREETWA